MHVIKHCSDDIIMWEDIKNRKKIYFLNLFLPLKALSSILSIKVTLYF